MSVLDRARAHLADRERGRLEVPEWGEEGRPLVVTWSPMTVRQHNKIYPPGKPVGSTNAVMVVIVKAQDEAGKPLFTEADRPALEDEVDSAVVSRIANAILASRQTVKEAEKN
ncbi:MAG: hypothetical protein VW338_00845 [Rhodospirillaceae bacterium]